MSNVKCHFIMEVFNANSLNEHLLMTSLMKCSSILCTNRKSKKRYFFRKQIFQVFILVIRSSEAELYYDTKKSLVLLLNFSSSSPFIFQSLL